MDTGSSKFDSTDDYQPDHGPGSKALTDEEVKRLGDLQEEFAERTRSAVSNNERNEVQNDIQNRLVREGNSWADVWAHAAANGYTRRDAKYRVMLDWFNNWVTKARDDKQFGQFSDLQPLGSGGFGAVFRGYDSKLRRLVAIKLPHVPPERMPGDWDTVRTSAQQHANFFEEARKHANITVPGCVAIHESGMPDTFDIDQVLVHLRTTPIWFSMQFIDGKSLDNVLHEMPGGYKRGETIPDDQVIELMTKIAERLQNLHATQSPNGNGCIIHKDLKPANILLDQQNNPWLTDFGLASARFDQTVTGNPFSGTRAYAAPEQFAGIEANEQTDIWAWGVIFYELLTGQLPFDGPVRICNGASPVPKLRVARFDQPEYLELIINKCLQRERGNRYGSFAAVLGDLRPSIDRFGRSEDQNEKSPNRRLAKETDRDWSHASVVERVIGVGFGFNGTVVLICSSDVPFVCDPQSNKSWHTLDGRHAAKVECAIVSPDGRRLLTGDRDGWLKIWNIEHFPTELAEVEVAPTKLKTWIMCVACSNDPDVVIVGSGNSLWKWKPDVDWRILATIPGKEIRCIALSGDGRNVIAGNGNGTIWRVDAESGESLQLDLKHYGAVSSIDCTHDGSLLVTGCEDKCVRFWSHVPSIPHLAHGGAVTCVCLSSDGVYAVSGDRTGGVCLWDTARRAVIQQWKHQGAVRSLAIDEPHAGRVAIASDTSTCIRRI